MDYYVAWWNVENLFDRATAARPPRLASKLAGELVGWTAAVLQRKVSQLASIILQMNGGQGPDLLGVCEVENRAVLERLVAALASLGRNYAIAHHDGGDSRGIDVAFLYDADLFEAEEEFFHVVLKRSTTRDIFQVNFRTSGGRVLSMIGNHWPSRLGGTHESEPYRILAAETLSYWMSRIQELRGLNANVVVMGDFNDEPWDRSLTQYALSTQSRNKVTYARSPRLLNLMFPIAGQALGTHYFDNFPGLLDQLLVSRGVARTSGEIRLVPDSVEVLRLPEMISGGRYPAPLRFGRPSRASTFDEDGFSDHFPIAVRLREPGV